MALLANKHHAPYPTRQDVNARAVHGFIGGGSSGKHSELAMQATLL